MAWLADRRRNPTPINTGNFAPVTIAAAGRSILCASGTDGKPVCKAWDAVHDPRRPDPTVQPDNNQIPHYDGLRD